MSKRYTWDYCTLASRVRITVRIRVWIVDRVKISMMIRVRVKSGLGLASGLYNVRLNDFLKSALYKFLNETSVCDKMSFRCWVLLAMLSTVTAQSGKLQSGEKHGRFDSGGHNGRVDSSKHVNHSVFGSHEHHVAHHNETGKGGLRCLWARLSLHLQNNHTCKVFISRKPPYWEGSISWVISLWTVLNIPDLFNTIFQHIPKCLGPTML